MKLFRATFRFTGGEIVSEFLVSTGWLPGAHAALVPRRAASREGAAALDGGAALVCGRLIAA